MMKKTFASQSFAVLTAALMMVGTAACSSAPVQDDQPISAEVPASAPAADETVSSTTSSVQSSDTSSQAPVINDTPIDSSSSAPSSLGASSSGRGH